MPGESDCQSACQNSPWRGEVVLVWGTMVTTACSLTAFCPFPPGVCEFCQEAK